MMETLAFAAALGALVPSYFLVSMSDEAFVRLLPAPCNCVLDVDLLLSASAIYAHLECMGSLGRTMYFEFYHFDLVLAPLIYSTSLVGVISRVWPTNRVFWVLENVGMCILLTQLPTPYAQVEVGVSFLTRAKGVFLAISIVVMVIGVAINALKGKRSVLANHKKD